jgi:hypothetical protein
VNNIERGVGVIAQYRDEQGAGYANETVETTLVDVLADLMAWADDQGIDFEACLSRAEGHWREDA